MTARLDPGLAARFVGAEVGHTEPVLICLRREATDAVAKMSGVVVTWMSREHTIMAAQVTGAGLDELTHLDPVVLIEADVAMSALDR